MLQFSKMAHVLALGLWYGTALFFTFGVGILLFGTFQPLGERPAEGRPEWLPLGPHFDRDPASWGGDGPFRDRSAVRREQGTRVAGAAVGPMFPWYFLLQGVCGLVSLATAWGWSRVEPRRRVHTWRTLLLALALVTVLAGWPLEQRVAALRVERGEAVDEVLRAAMPSADQVSAATRLAREFGTWHVYSLFLNFGTCGLVMAAMALAARLPAGPPTS